MKVLKIVSAVFSTVGIGMLVVSFFVFSNTTSFISRAVEADGRVTDLERSRSSSSSGSSTTYRPVVEFTTATGKHIEFVSSVGSSPPSHSVGEAVKVLYNPADPQRARIKSFFQLWFGFLIVFLLGLVFAAIGLGMIFVRRRDRKRAEWLRQHGRRMKTAFKGVELNQSLRVNGRCPYQIVSQSSDAASNTVRLFQSENIWFDPSEYIKGEVIDVLVDPNDPKRYVMDISFLPKLDQ
ncbi:MAG: hypothetical protein QOH59_3018 [Gemmatimonadales bacterium]|nr:hypothetical protein [Gemmatimonadales bacterium]